MKKITFLLIVLLLFMTACGNKNITEVSEETVNSNIFKGELPDFDGYEFLLKTTKHGAYKESPNAPLAPPEVGIYERWDKILDRYNQVEEALNVVVSVEMVGDDSAFPPEVATAYATGDKYGDILDLYGRHIFANRGNYFVAVQDIDTNGIIDLENGFWGSANQIAQATFNGKTYGLTTANWGLPIQSAKGYLMVNDFLLTKANTAIPNELREKKLWNWQAFEDICTAVNDTSSEDVNEQIYGFVCTNNSSFIESAILSNGGHWVTETDGKYIFDLDNPESIEAMEWVQKLLYEKKIGKHFNEWSQPGKDKFVELKTAFFSENAFGVLGYHYEILIEQPYSFTSFPTGPKGDPTKDVGTMLMDENRYIGIMNTFEDDYTIPLTIMKYIFSPLEGETADSWKVEMERNHFYNSESFNFYIEGLEKATYDYSAISFKAIADQNNKSLIQILKNVMLGKSIIEQIESNKEAIQVMLDDGSNLNG